MQKTVFFDLGNVVLYFSHEKMCKQMASFCEIEESAVREILFSKQWNDRYEIGEVNSWDLFYELTRQKTQNKPFAGLMKAMSDIFEPNESLVPVIKALKKNQVRLYILSNTCEAHFSYAFTHYPILHLFDGYILSYEAKLRKPDSKIYKYAVEKALSSKKDCFYVDDMQEYIEAAKKEGLDAEAYIDTHQLIKQLNDRDLLPLSEKI